MQGPLSSIVALSPQCAFMQNTIWIGYLMYFLPYCVLRVTVRRLRTILFYLKNFRFEKIDLKV